MAIERSTGLPVANHYGPRVTQEGIVSGGNVFTSGSQFEGVVYITGDDFAGTTRFATQLTLPAGAIPLEAIKEVTEAFSTGADNIFAIGELNDEVAHGFPLANPRVTGVTKNPSKGEFAMPLPADTPIGVHVAGTDAEVTAGVGRAKVVIRYQMV